MNLDTLIQQLETAAGLATGGECRTEATNEEQYLALGMGGVHMASYLPKDTAQAIAIRHNTAAQVISELKAQRARADRAEALSAKLTQRFLDLEDVVDWKGLFKAESKDRERLAARIKELTTKATDA